MMDTLWRNYRHPQPFPHGTTNQDILMIPTWLHVIALLSLAAGYIVAAIIVIEVIRHPQQMAVMNVVWPVTALYASLVALWFYVRYGHRDDETPKGAPPFSIMAGKGTAHCGAACTLGDIIAESLAFLFPTIAVWFGWHTLFAEKMFAIWIVDFIFAFTLGIAFQYFAIAPMRGLSFRKGIVAALKADTLSLIAWQVGMYGFMALAQYAYYRPLLGRTLEANTPEFWFTMQLAMIAGFFTSYPVNWWLIKAGIKERM